MATIKSETNKELEVFVHGALCVSYSGQCLTSESILLVLLLVQPNYPIN
jgi:putative protease